MKANTREAELLDGVELEEPHFDEEATVLSARPVVPLEVVEKKERSGKRWAFAAVIVVGLLIGAFSAALVYKLREPEPSNVAQEGELAQPIGTLEAGVGAIVAAEPSSSNEPVVEQAAEKIPAKAPVSPVRGPGSVSGIGRQNRDSADDRDERLAEERELQKENRRAEKKMERRRLRRAERQAQRDGEARSDDLLRIREIFEGAPRP